ncbi:hypothetical protein V8G54_024101 [Vigna mungo]|uniref:SF3A2 domain-containing protein n=1 Tax=Vigna mungo TaxID=3915 RepID=A0AAQ3N6H6_VIGMU
MAQGPKSPKGREQNNNDLKKHVWRDGSRMGIEARERRRGVGAERSHRPARASPATGSGDDRPSEGPVFHAEPPWELRVQTVSHSPQQRGQLLGPHSGQAPPDQLGQTTPPPSHNPTSAKSPFAKQIGRPGYRVTKQYDPETKQRSLLFQIEYPEIENLVKPRHRFMSSYEQRVQPFDKRYQYLLFAAEPYEIIAFKKFALCSIKLHFQVPSTEIDKSTPKFFSHWDPDSKMFTVSSCAPLVCL